MELDQVWYAYDGRTYRPIGRDESLVGDLQRWASGHVRVKGKGEDAEVVPARPTARECREVLGVVRQEVMIDPQDLPGVGAGLRSTRFWRAEIGPGWKGAPVSARPAWERVERSPEGFPPPDAVLPVGEGLLDLEAWDRGELVVLPHTPRLFSVNLIPAELPLERLRGLADQAGSMAPGIAETDEPEELGRARAIALAGLLRPVVAELAPRFTRFLAEALGAEPVAEDVVRLEAEPERLEAVRRKCRAEHDENERELAKFGGYVLRPDTRHHRGNLMILHGEGGTGKSTLLEVLVGVLGDNAISTSVEQLADPPHLYEFRGKLLAYMPDERTVDWRSSAYAANVIKAITGESALSLRTVYRRALPNEWLYTRFLVALNEMWDLRDDALLRRMVVIDFQRKPAAPDSGLRSALARERVGQLLWMLLGRLWLRIDGEFRQPPSSSAPLAAYAEDVGVYDQFVAECLEVTNDAEDLVEGQDLYRLFAEWATEQGWRSVPTWGSLAKKLVPVLRRAGYRMGAASVPGGDVVQRRVDGQRVRMRAGLRLRRQPGERAYGQQGSVWAPD